MQQEVDHLLGTIESDRVDFGVDGTIFAPSAKIRDFDRAPAILRKVKEEAEAKEGGEGTVYPKMESVYFSQSPAEIAAAAEQIMKKRGWEIVSNQANGDTTQVEATATSGWFGFKDDVAIRIRPANGATEVDIRSTSRVGLSDLGANSARVYGLMVELEDRADGRRAP